MSERSAELQIVGIRVSDRNDTMNMLSDIRLHVADDSFDIVGRGLSRATIENDLVTSQERQRVVVPREDLNDTENMLEVHRSVCGPWHLVVQVLVLQRRVDIENQVDSSSSQKGHTLIMVGSRVYRVNTNSVDTKLLEEVDITGTGLWVGKRVTTFLNICRTTRLVVNSLELFM